MVQRSYGPRWTLAACHPAYHPAYATNTACGYWADCACPGIPMDDRANVVVTSIGSGRVTRSWKCSILTKSVERPSTTRRVCMSPVSKKSNYEMETILFDTRTHLTEEWEPSQEEHRYPGAVTLIRLAGSFSTLCKQTVFDVVDAGYFPTSILIYCRQHGKAPYFLRCCLFHTHCHFSPPALIGLEPS